MLLPNTNKHSFPHIPAALDLPVMLVPSTLLDKAYFQDFSHVHTIAVTINPGTKKPEQYIITKRTLSFYFFVIFDQREKSVSACIDAICCYIMFQVLCATVAVP